jgi:hypothetical protein
LKFQNLASVGDVVRGYDFRDNKDAYIEGRVIAKGEVVIRGMYMYDAYTIVVEKDGAEFGREGETMCIPFEVGVDYDGRVELICEVTPETV